MKRLLVYEVPKSSSCAMGMDDEVDNIIVVVVAPCLSRRTFNFEARARREVMNFSMSWYLWPVF